MASLFPPPLYLVVVLPLVSTGKAQGVSKHRCTVVVREAKGSCRVSFGMAANGVFRHKAALPQITCRDGQANFI